MSKSLCPKASLQGQPFSIGGAGVGWLICAWDMGGYWDLSGVPRAPAKTNTWRRSSKRRYAAATAAGAELRTWYQSSRYHSNISNSNSAHLIEIDRNLHRCLDHWSEAVIDVQISCKMSLFWFQSQNLLQIFNYHHVYRAYILAQQSMRIISKTGLWLVWTHFDINLMQ